MADIHRDIKDPPAHHPHQFHLRMGRFLEMQAAHGAHRPGQRVVILHEDIMNTGTGQRAGVIGLREKPACVAELARCQQLEVGNGEGRDVHILEMVSIKTGVVKS